MPDAPNAQTMEQLIQAELCEIERARGVRVLYAVESGSRAWGFASPDSDYDVRFVYAAPLESYLHLGTRRDVIEWQLDEVYDVSGWDLSKALRLLRASNPGMFEWLGSPIVYREDPCFAQVRGVAASCFSPRSAAYHYLHMAKNNARGFLQKDEVKLKKYLYVIRALLGARWAIERATPVPVPFPELADAMLEERMRPCIEQVLAEKQAAREGQLHKRIPELDVWIDRTLAWVEEHAEDAPAPEKPGWPQLDEVFLNLISRNTGNDE